MSAVVLVIISITACVLLVMKVNADNRPPEPVVVAITPEEQKAIDDKVKADAIAEVKAEAEKVKADALAKVEAEVEAKEKVAKAKAAKEKAAQLKAAEAKAKEQASYVNNDYDNVIAEVMRVQKIHIENGTTFDYFSANDAAEVDFMIDHGLDVNQYNIDQMNDFTLNGGVDMNRLFVAYREMYNDGYDSEIDCRNPDMTERMRVSMCI